MTNPALVRLPSTALILALGSGCAPDFDVDLSAVRGPRLLAIASSPAELKAGEQTTLSALVAVPPGSSAPAVSWSLCLERKPLTELGPVNAECLDLGNDAARVELGRGDSALATLDQDACRLFGPLRPPAVAGEPAGRPVDPDITGGFYQPIVASLGGVAALGAIRIDCDPANLNRDDALRFRSQYRANENPRIRELLQFASGSAEPLEPDAPGALEVPAGEPLPLRVSWDECPGDAACSGAEPYVWYDREAQRVAARREGISVAWYTSRGHFASEQTGLDESEAGDRHHSENTLHPGAEPGPITLWLVIRDTRGGQSWQTYLLQIP